MTEHPKLSLSALSLTLTLLNLSLCPSQAKKADDKLKEMEKELRKAES